jgi:hypothetical protein
MRDSSGPARARNPGPTERSPVVCPVASPEMFCPAKQELRRKSSALTVHARAHVHPRIFAEGVHTAGPVNTDAHVKGVVIGSFVGGCMNGAEPIYPGGISRYGGRPTRSKRGSPGRVHIDDCSGKTAGRGRRAHDQGRLQVIGGWLRDLTQAPSENTGDPQPVGTRAGVKRRHTYHQVVAGAQRNAPGVWLVRTPVRSAAARNCFSASVESPALILAMPSDTWPAAR